MDRVRIEAVIKQISAKPIERSRVVAVVLEAIDQKPQFFQANLVDDDGRASQRGNENTVVRLLFVLRRPPSRSAFPQMIDQLRIGIFLEKSAD
jgi:hypothetical protein